MSRPFWTMMDVNKWFQKKAPLDRKAVSPRLAEVLFMARNLTAEIRNMDHEATKMVLYWNGRLTKALDELEATLKRGESQPNKEKY